MIRTQVLNAWSDFRPVSGDHWTETESLNAKLASHAFNAKPNPYCH